MSYGVIPSSFGPLVIRASKLRRSHCDLVSRCNKMELDGMLNDDRTDCNIQTFQVIWKAEPFGVMITDVC